MNVPSDRMRKHPEERFEAPQHLYDLDEVTKALRAEPLPTSRNHRQKTIYKGGDPTTGPVTVALFVFDKGAAMPRHIAQGVVTIHVIEGQIRILAEGQEHQLQAQQILVLAPGVAHDVLAESDARMLLTVCLDA